MDTVAYISTNLVSSLSDSLNYSYGPVANTVSNGDLSAGAITGLGALFIGASVILPIIFMFFILILSFGLTFTIGYLVYKDAKKNNIENPELWGIISGTTWIGLILYFVINKRDK